MAMIRLLPAEDGTLTNRRVLGEAPTPAQTGDILRRIAPAADSGLPERITRHAHRADSDTL